MPRNDAEALRARTQSSIQLSNSPMMNVRLAPDMHHRPGSLSGLGKPVVTRAWRLRHSRQINAVLPTRGVRNDRAFHRARGAMCEHMAPCARKAHGKHSHGSGSTPAFRTRMDFAACCMSQGLSLAPTRPRSCELSPGHALGPSARRAGVCPRPFEDPRSSTRSGSGIVAAIRIPLRVSKTIATRPSSARDGGDDIRPRR